MNKKICFQCKTENDEGFRYCKRCGAVLPIVDERTDLDAEVVSENAQNTRFEEASIDGVSEEHLKAYIGKNHPRILDSFYNMCLYNKKTSFCVPVLILGLFFGFFGMSCWFFYRKMNKIGFLLLSIPLIFSLVDIALNFEVLVAFLRNYSTLFSSYVADAEAFSAELNSIVNELRLGFKSFIPDIRSLVECVVAPIVMSVFSLYLYKNKAVSSIKAICLANENDSNLQLRLFLSGGTSAVRVLIPFAVFGAFTFALCLAEFAFLV